MTDLVRSTESPDQSLESLRARATELEVRLMERASEVARLKSDLAAFKIDYRQRVGLLHDELDEIELAIAEAELGEITRRLDQATVAPGEGPVADASSASPRLTSDAVRKLFRDVAKAIHPDLAGDDRTRDRRHSLMIEANRAYALGDEERLRAILESWEHSPDAVQGNDAEAMRARLVRRVTQIEQELATFAADLDALRSSPMGKLKAMVDDSAARGADLVDDMVRRLRRDIMAARNRLDALRWTPEGGR